MRPLAELDARGVRAVLVDIDDTLTTDGKLTAARTARSSACSAPGCASCRSPGAPRAGATTSRACGRSTPWSARTAPSTSSTTRNRLQKRFHDSVGAAGGEARAPGRDRRRKSSTAVPGCALASDQPYRETDLAIDYCEDVPPLPLEAAQRIAALMRHAGLTAKVSSIHVNGWFGDYDKLAMTRRLFAERFGLDLGSREPRRGLRRGFAQRRADVRVLRELGRRRERAALREPARRDSRSTSRAARPARALPSSPTTCSVAKIV